jgi:hypothetical protein
MRRRGYVGPRAPLLDAGLVVGGDRLAESDAPEYPERWILGVDDCEDRS